MNTSNDLDEFPKRLLEFIHYLRITPNKFATKVGIGERTMSNATKGSDSSRSLIQAIGKRYKMLNMNWLINGEGAMLKSDALGSVLDSEEPITAEPESNYGNKDKCQNELEKALLELQYLRNQVVHGQITIQDKDVIIKLLQEK